MDLNRINRRYNSASGISGAKKIYMIGIKGVGMTMLAQFLAEKGIDILGSDVNEKFMTDEILKKEGIKVFEKFNLENIPSDVDLVIYSTAYNSENNIEVKHVLDNKKIKVLTYAEALGEIFKEYYGIAVVGTHGKTTTTAWLGFVMQESGLEPSVMVGSKVEQFKGSSLVGKSDYLVIEADEYQNKLKYFNPKAVLLNNIEHDHHDFFKTKEEYESVFIDFIKKIPKKGFLVANFDDPIIRKIGLVNCHAKVITYAINEIADYIAYDIKKSNGKQYFKVKLRNEEDDCEINELGDFCISLSGRHNISNALAVIATSVELDIKLVDIRKSLEEFKGTERRMQVLGKFRGAIIIDDYAHHPTEIKATLSGARDMYGEHSRIVVVFHPHTYTRTKALLDDFSKSFNLADEVIVLDIYGSAREAHGGVHSQELVEKIKKYKVDNQKILYIPTLDKCEEYLRENIKRNDIILLMGAGDVFKIGKKLVEKE